MSIRLGTGVGLLMTVFLGSACQKSSFAGETKPQPAVEEQEKPKMPDMPIATGKVLGQSAKGQIIEQVDLDDSRPPQTAADAGGIVLPQSSEDLGNDPGNVLNAANETGQTPASTEEILQQLAMPNTLPTSLDGLGGDTPLVLDANGDKSFTTLYAKSGRHVLFDIDGSGSPKLIEWIAPGDWFLAWDRNGDGKIDSGRELFGNATFPDVANGFLALSRLDVNGDGVIDYRDYTYGDLVVWKDDNGNALTDPGELQSLFEVGITSISLRYVDARINLKGSASYIGQIGSFRRNEKEQTIADVYFRTQPALAARGDR